MADRSAIDDLRAESGQVDRTAGSVVPSLVHRCHRRPHVRMMRERPGRRARCQRRCRCRAYLPDRPPPGQFIKHLLGHHAVRHLLSHDQLQRYAAAADAARIDLYALLDPADLAEAGAHVS